MEKTTFVLTSGEVFDLKDPVHTRQFTRDDWRALVTSMLTSGEVFDLKEPIRNRRTWGGWRDLADSLLIGTVAGGVFSAVTYLMGWWR